jgi:recombination protein RecT
MSLPASQQQGQVAKKSPVDSLKEVMEMPSVQQQFRNALAEKSAPFVASLIDLYASDSGLQRCKPQLVVMEALKAAVLNLPIARSLGFAWIIPYGKSIKNPDGSWAKEKNYVPQFQVGWKGILQLAQRSGQYRYINCGEVYEGQYRGEDRLTGIVDISGEPTSETVVGFFAFFELLNGFRKTSYWSKKKVEDHAVKYNPECKRANKLTGVWAEHFQERAKVTVLKHLIAKYGPMSIDMAMAVETIVTGDQQDQSLIEYQNNANRQLIEMDESSAETRQPQVDPETGEIIPDNPPQPQDAMGSLPPFMQ